MLLTAAGAVLLAAGCAQEAPHQAQYSPVYSSWPTRVYSQPRQVIVVPSDGSIAAAVRESLRRNVEIAPIVPNIQINANNGAVSLNGWVQSVEQKHQIGVLARDVAGVVAVNNQLVPLVDTSSPRPPVQDQSQSANPLLNDSANGGAGQANHTNGLAPTAAPGGSEKLYQQNTPEPVQNTNNNPMP